VLIDSSPRSEIWLSSTKPLTFCTLCCPWLQWQVISSQLHLLQRHDQNWEKTCSSHYQHVAASFVLVSIVCLFLCITFASQCSNFLAGQTPLPVHLLCDCLLRQLLVVPEKPWLDLTNIPARKGHFSFFVLVTEVWSVGPCTVPGSRTCAAHTVPPKGVGRCW